jgi:hypothetical protein
MTTTPAFLRGGTKNVSTLSRIKQSKSRQGSPKNSLTKIFNKAKAARVSGAPDVVSSSALPINESVVATDSASATVVSYSLVKENLVVNDVQPEMGRNISKVIRKRIPSLNDLTTSATSIPVLLKRNSKQENKGSHAELAALTGISIDDPDISATSPATPTTITREQQAAWALLKNPGQNSPGYAFAMPCFEAVDIDIGLGKDIPSIQCKTIYILNLDIESENTSVEEPPMLSSIRKSKRFEF